MNASRVARRYGKAIFQLALERLVVPQVGRDIERLTTELRAHPEVRRVLLDPLVCVETKRRVLESLSRSLILLPLTKCFLSLLNDRKRFGELDGILRDYRERQDEAAGQTRASVVSSNPLTTLETQRLRAALQRATGKTVLLETSVDAELVGGVLARIGNTVYDGSVRRALERARSKLLDAAH